MSHVVHCVKFGQDLEGLSCPPFPGKLGERIYQEVSVQAWDAWLSHQTMLINEYRLSAIDPKARTFLRSELEKFLFGEGSAKPQGYVPVS